MCDPITIIKMAATALSVAQGLQKQRAARQLAQRQNDIALEARREKENAENLRIRQIAIRKRDKKSELIIESREKQATARTAAESVGGAGLDRVVNNYLRIEGKYVSKIDKNLEMEIAQSNINKRLFAHEQEARQAYIPEVDYAGAFASTAISFGGDWFEWKARKDEKDIMKKRHEEMMKGMG